MTATRPSKASLLSSTFTGLTTQYVNAIASGVLQIGMLAILARLLTPDDYGVMGLATIYTALGMIFSQFGLSVAIVQRPHLTDRDIRAGFTLAMVLGATMALLTIAIAPWVANDIFKAPALTPILRVLSLTFPFTNLGFVAESLLDRHLAWRRAMWVNLSAFAVGNAAVGLTLAFLGTGIWALVGAQLGERLLRSVLLLRAQPHPKRLLIDGHEIRELLHFGRGLTLARLLNYVAGQGDYVVVGRVLGVTLLGFYTRAFKLMLLPVTYFALIVTKVLFPIMARLQAERDKLSLTYLAGAAVMGIVSAPLSAVMIVVAPELINVLLGPKWTPAIVPFQILALGVTLRNSYLLAYSLDGALGDSRKRIIRDAIYAACVIVGSVVAVRFGLAGVSVAVLVAMIANYAVAAQMSRQLLRFSWSEYFHSQWPGFVLGATAALLALLARAGLRAAGMPPLVVLTGASVATVAVLGALLFLRPQITGRYGRVVMRLAADALTNRLPPRALQWLRQAA